MITIFGKSVPTELEELVAPRQTALIIIDMQNDFCTPGGTADLAGTNLGMYPQITPRIAHVARVAREVGIPVVHLSMCSLPDGRSDSVAWLRIRLRGKKNIDPRADGIYQFTIEGTWGAEFVDALQPEPGDSVVRKFRSSGFHDTSLDMLLRSQSIRNVIVTGCTTEGCVESTVRDATFFDYVPVVLDDCVGSDDVALHDASLKVMGAYRADIANSEQVIETWSAVGGADPTIIGGRPA
jgi:nicotinamidase-related amidase